MLNARDEVERLLDQIRAISPSQAVERASNQISVLCRGYMTANTPSAWDKFKFSKREQRFVNRIFARPDTLVTREAIMDAVYFDQHKEPSAKIIDVFMTRIRSKLVGSPYSIETIHGYGFKGHIVS